VSVRRTTAMELVNENLSSWKIFQLFSVFHVGGKGEGRDYLFLLRNNKENVRLAKS